LLEQQKINLKIGAIELFTKIIVFLEENNLSSLVNYVDPIITLLSDSCQRQQVEEEYPLQITVLRTIVKILSKVNLFDRMHTIIPCILQLLYDPEDTQYEFKQPSLDPQKSLADLNVKVSRQDLREAAADALFSIAHSANLTTLQYISKPTFKFIDDKKLWTPSYFPSGVIKIFLKGGWDKHGFNLVLPLISHFGTPGLSMAAKISVIKVISLVLDKQPQQSSVGPQAIECLLGLTRQLLLERPTSMDQETSSSVAGGGTSGAGGIPVGADASHERLDFQDSVWNTICMISKKGEHSGQNLEFLNTLTGLLKKNTNDQEIEIILKTMLKIAAYHASVPSGKFYPDPLVKSIMEESITRNPKCRELLLELLLNFVNKAVVKEEEVSTATDKVAAKLSKKQRDEVYYYLFKGTLLKDNTNKTLAWIFLNFIHLLKFHRARDLEQLIPIMLRLQELSSLDSIIHALVAAFFYIFAALYNNAELIAYVTQIIDARSKNNEFTSPQFLKFLGPASQYSESLFVMPETKDLEKLYFVPTEEPYKSVSQDHLFDKEKLIGLICKIDQIKQLSFTGNQDAKDALSKTYSGDDYNRLMQDKNDEDNIKWDQLIAADESSEMATSIKQTLTATLHQGTTGGILNNIPVDLFEDQKFGLEEVKKANYSQIGEAACLKQQAIQNFRRKMLRHVAQLTIGDNVNKVANDTPTAVAASNSSVTAATVNRSGISLGTNVIIGGEPAVDIVDEDTSDEEITVEQQEEQKKIKEQQSAINNIPNLFNIQFKQLQMFSNFY